MVQDQLAFSIAQFCKLHGISRSFYYILEHKGRAPKTLNLGRRRLITVEAAKRWREEMTAVEKVNYAEEDGENVLVARETDGSDQAAAANICSRALNDTVDPRGPRR